MVAETSAPEGQLLRFLQVAQWTEKRIDAGAFLPPDPKTPLRDAVRAWLTGIVRFKAFDLALATAFRAQVLASGPTRDHPVDAGAHAAPSPEARFDAKKSSRRLPGSR